MRYLKLFMSYSIGILVVGVLFSALSTAALSATAWATKAVGWPVSTDILAPVVMVFVVSGLITAGIYITENTDLIP